MPASSRLSGGSGVLGVSSEHVLVVGDAAGEVDRAVRALDPGLRVSRADSWFSAIQFLIQQPPSPANRVSTVLAAAEPIERRPESAVRMLRQLAGDARLVLFGDPTLEPLSRKMLQFGCDDYIISPPALAEIGQVLGAPRMRIAPAGGASDATPAVESSAGETDPLAAARNALAVADAALAALLDSPYAAVESSVKRIAAHLGLGDALRYVSGTRAGPAQTPDGLTILSHAVRGEGADIGHLSLTLAPNADASSARHLLSRLAAVIGQVKQIQSRQATLHQLATTDELTGLRNARHFRHLLTRILGLARKRRFPVTLFIFDIDNFKLYNDRFGHGMGDEILRQTAQLMKRCCREHDIIARIGGDEFAVVFWEKDPPRAPRTPPPAPPPGPLKPPQTPVEVLNRFRRQLATHDLPHLGEQGKGTLTISGGLAVFPYDAGDVDQLIAAADSQLMQRAKKSGKNSIYLVGTEDMLPTG